MKVTPQWVGTFETNIQSRIVDAWERVEENLIWDKVMETRKSETLRELYFWLVETSVLRPQGTDGNGTGAIRFDDIAATFQEIDNTISSNALKLTTYEIEDNMMNRPGSKGMPALDYAANWAKQMGGSGAYYPQDLLFNTLIANGKTKSGYDGVNFFGTTHPLNPATGGGGTYSNLLSALPLTTAANIQTAAANLNSAVAAMRALKQPNGKQRFLRPRVLLHAPSEQYTVNQLLDAKFFNATDNVFTRLGIEPVCADELSAEPGVWYLGAELLMGEGAAFVFQERDPYKLTSYAADSTVELKRREEFEYFYRGRNAGAYGHPYLIFRIEPT